MPVAIVNWLWIGNRGMLDATPNTPIFLSERRVLAGYKASGSSQIKPVAVSGDYIGQGTNANSFATVWDTNAKGIAPTAFSYDLDGASTSGARMTSAFAVNMRVQTGSEPDVYQTQPATLVQLSNGDMFFRPNANALGAWDSIDRVYSIQVASIDESPGTAYGSISQRVTFSPEIFDVSFPCFAAGTLIATPEGEKCVEMLKDGDLVLTSNDGAVPVRWIGTATIDLRSAPDLRPVRIVAGALGCGKPSRDLIVSPQHRILVRSKIATRMFGTDEILVAAKQLLCLEGVERDEEMPFVTYVHFMCDQHQVVRANGAESESLFVGGVTLRSIGRTAREEIFEIFPRLRHWPESRSARLMPSGRRARKLAQRHLENGIDLIS